MFGAAAPGSKDPVGAEAVRSDLGDPEECCLQTGEQAAARPSARLAEAIVLPEALPPAGDEAGAAQ
jgi:hypothetical protein